MTESYLTVGESGIFEQELSRSRFIGVLQALPRAEDAGEILAAAARRFPAATHYCYAYIADSAGNELKYSDAGEPQGTAGLPILGVLQKRGLRKCILIVARYFGGVKLGAGGLARAYAGTAAGAADAAAPVRMRLARYFEASLSYPAYARMERLWENLPAEVLEIRYADGVTVALATPESCAGGVVSKLSEAALGAAEIREIKTDYHPFKKRGLL